METVNNNINAQFGVALEERASSLIKGNRVGGNEGFAYGRP